MTAAQAKLEAERRRRDVLVRLAKATEGAGTAVGALTRAHVDVVMALGVDHAASTAARATLRAAERVHALLVETLKRAP